MRKGDGTTDATKAKNNEKMEKHEKESVAQKHSGPLELSPLARELPPVEVRNWLYDCFRRLTVAARHQEDHADTAIAEATFARVCPDLSAD